MTAYLRLLSFARAHGRRLAAALACLFAFALLSGASIGLVSPFMRVLFAGRGAAPLPLGVPAAGTGAHAGGALQTAVERRLFTHDPLSSLARICVAVLLVTALKDLFNYLQAYLLSTVEQRVIRDLRDTLYRHLHRMPLAYFHERRAGALVSRITSDVSAVRDALNAGLSYALKDALLFLVCLGWVVWVSWKLAVVSAAVLLATGLVLRAISRHVRRQTHTAQARMADMTSTLQEALSGIRVVKAFGSEEYEIGRFRAQTAAYCRAAIRMRRVAAAAPPLTELLGTVAVVTVIWVGGQQVLGTATLPPDRFFVFVSAILALMMPVRSLANAFTQIQSGSAAASRVFAVLDTPPAMLDRPGARRADGFRRAITLEDVRFRYGTNGGPDVLSGISLTFEKGAMYAIVGPSGAGKSTLADLLPRFYDPVEGRVLLDGVDLRDLALDSLRSLMGIVTQETILFHDTVERNIAYGANGVDPARVRRAAEMAHADEFIQRMPQGYETVIGDRGLRLSGGERQRLALARAILRDPPILILDEATSALDAESERYVQEAMEALMRGRTAIVIAHRLATVERADRIVVLDRGRIVGEGTHDELLRTHGLYRRLSAVDLQA